MDNLNKLNKQENQQESEQEIRGEEGQQENTEDNQEEGRRVSSEHSKFLSTQDLLSREGIAKQKDTSPEILALLAEDKNWLTRQRVAENPNTPPKVLASLVRDEDRDCLLYTSPSPRD